MGDRVLLGMSGGVDSAAAAVLLRQAGCEPVGCTLRLVSSADIGREGSCCSLEDVEDARAVAARLGEPLCEKAQRLMIVPASHGEVEDCLSVDANLVFMKAGRELGALRDTLAAHGLLERASMVANCGMEGETVCPRFADVPEGTGYFSVVLVKKGEQA